MINICVCVGSSCHIKGSNSVVERLKELVVHNNLSDKVELRASFCMGDCRDGVCMEIDGRKIRNVSACNIEEVFEREILSKGE